VGLKNSGRALILVDQSAEHLLSLDPMAMGRDGSETRLASVGWLLIEGPVGSMSVVVLQILGQDDPQVSVTDDQETVEALAA
jgi:hypothetical protein